MSATRCNFDQLEFVCNLHSLTFRYKGLLLSSTKIHPHTQADFNELFTKFSFKSNQEASERHKWPFRGEGRSWNVIFVSVNYGLSSLGGKCPEQLSSGHCGKTVRDVNLNINHRCKWNPYDLLRSFFLHFKWRKGTIVTWNWNNTQRKLVSIHPDDLQMFLPGEKKIKQKGDWSSSTINVDGLKRSWICTVNVKNLSNLLFNFPFKLLKSYNWCDMTQIRKKNSIYQKK